MSFDVKKNRLLTAILLSATVLGSGWAIAQIEGPDRGIRPIASTGDFEVQGIEVNVTGDSPDDARRKGWQEAQRLGWKKLWQNKRGGETSGLADGTLNSIVAAVVVEEEQIGPKRYVARLGVLFDRARAGQLLGVKGIARRSAPLLLLPIYQSAGSPILFEQRTPWQKAWATFRTADSKIDYVRPSGIGGESLLLNAGQLERRNRRWLRTILDEFGAADLIVPVARLERQWPGGPIVGHFSARYNVDNRYLGSFTLRAKNSDGIPSMMKQAVQKIDALYQEALTSGRLRVDARLILEEAIVREENLETAEPAEPAANGSSGNGNDGSSSDTTVGDDGDGPDLTAPLLPPDDTPVEPETPAPDPTPAPLPAAPQNGDDDGISSRGANTDFRLAFGSFISDFLNLRG